MRGHQQSSESYRGDVLSSILNGLQSRPYLVSQHWAAALESEWSSQLLLEKHLQLPPSVKPSDSRVGEANGQIWFNMTFARPLFELVAQGISCRLPLLSRLHVAYMTHHSDGTVRTTNSGEPGALAGSRSRARRGPGGVAGSAGYTVGLAVPSTE